MMISVKRLVLSLAILAGCFICHLAAAEAPANNTAVQQSNARQNSTWQTTVEDGYRGLWYACGWYQGGLGTYCAKHIPFAYYAKAVNKTFFVYGGVSPKGTLLEMVSYFDHNTQTVPRPTLLLDKQTTDGHDNPTIMLDDDGYVWVFANSHGTARPAYIFRSAKPYSIDAFDLIKKTNFSYSQPWYVPGKGFCMLCTQYEPGNRRNLFCWTSSDGLSWDMPQPLARIPNGQYQISWRTDKGVGTAFNYHPHPTVHGAARTNLYYMQTDDMGKSWTNIHGRPLRLPFTSACNPALVHDYQSESRLVFLKDIQFDKDENPVILYLTSKGPEPGKQNGPRIWHTARWTGKTWAINDVTESGHNYDMGSLYIKEDGTWRIIAPTEPGPQLGFTGGEVAMWNSSDQGRNWIKLKQLTRNSQRNHSYVRRPVNAHPDFYAFWADGDGRKKSESRLYFTNRTGDHVWQLPVKMQGSVAKPEIIW